MEKVKNQTIFIYGQLKQGKYFHDKYLGGDKSKFLGSATSGTEVTMFCDGLPHLLKENNNLPCKGELFLVDEDVLKSIDDLEAVPLIYFRDLIEVYNDIGEKVQAWTYYRHLNFKGKKSAWPESEFV